MARGCFFNASSTHHTIVRSYQNYWINGENKLCGAGIMVTCCASLRWRWLLRTDLVEKLWWHFYDSFTSSNSAERSLQAFTVCSSPTRFQYSESHLFIFFYLEILATKKILLFISSVIWWGDLPPQALLWFSQTNFPCARIVQPVFQREFKTLIK